LAYDLPSIDVQAPLMSAAFLLKTSVHTIPGGVPYLFCRIRSYLTVGKAIGRTCLGSKIGIAWQGNPKFAFDAERSNPFKCDGARLHRSLEPTLINLQKGFWPASNSQAFSAHRSIIDWTPENGQRGCILSTTAALMKGLDLISPSDTSMAHLAGALGVPVWVALGIVPDWRWMMDRSDHPGIPTCVCSANRFAETGTRFFAKWPKR